MRGRKPKPTITQIAAGDPRKLGVRKLQAKLDSEPKAARGLPACKPYLQGMARTAWKFWAEELEAMGLDRRPDAIMLEGACFNYAGAIQAEEIIAREGPTVTESLKVRAHPAVQIARQRWMLVKGFCSEFGLSPVSRTRLTVEKGDETDADLMAMLSEPREPKPAVN